MLHRPNGSVRCANGTLSEVSSPSCSKTAFQWPNKTRQAQNSAQSRPRSFRGLSSKTASSNFKPPSDHGRHQLLGISHVPEGLAVFTLPEHHRKRLRTSNPIERSVQQELKRRTVKVRVFPSEDALLRLVSVVLVEIDEKWASETKAYIKWECQDA